MSYTFQKGKYRARIKSSFDRTNGNTGIYSYSEYFPFEYDISSWETKSWSGFTPSSGNEIWTDGINIYYSHGYYHYVLDGDTWIPKTWMCSDTGYELNLFNGKDIWHAYGQTYLSNDYEQLILNHETGQWDNVIWNEHQPTYGHCIWTDGENVYYSYSEDRQYVLDPLTNTWNIKTWSGLIPGASGIWTDGENIYDSYYRGFYDYEHHVLIKSTSTWVEKQWDEPLYFYGNEVWTDGKNIYCSSTPDFGSTQLIFDKSTSTWHTKTWRGFAPGSGSYIWTDGTNIYYSHETDQYVLT